MRFYVAGLALFLVALPASADRIAVIGDSISTGAHASDRALNGYPGRLGHLFEGTHEVRAFARGGHCLLRKSDSPLSGTPQFKAAVEWAPDVALIMLGTNDSSEKRPNWRHHGDLEADARFYLEELRQVSPDVEVHFLGPPPMFPDKAGLKAERKADLAQRAPHLVTIRDTYRRIAAGEPRVFHHDLSRALTADRTSDGVHPDTFGHEQIAHHLHDLLTTGIDETFDLPGGLEAAGVTARRGEFHGYRRFNFVLPGEGAKSTIVVPQQAAAGRPWIWRARFFGHQPELDLTLLDRGYHLAYCDVGNLYGCDKALDRWDAFHAFATGKLGLGPKPILEGMSRGGLPIFLWASRNPDKVSAVYGDNPVCDFRSWPGGRPGKGSAGDWKRLLGAYGLTGEEAATHRQPVDQEVLQPIAAAKVPVALVLGMADDVVPPFANGEVLGSRFAKLGGELAVWTKPGAGHHPHGLHPADPLRRFLTRVPPPSVLPSPSSEFRSGAGWGKENWHQAFAQLKKMAAANPEARIVFLGDSISQGLTGHADRVARPGGKRPIDRHLGESRALSLGLSGDRTEHVLWRIGHGQLDGLSPEWVVVLIGVNNINAAGHTGRETALGTAAMVVSLREKLPGTKILLLGAFPTGKSPDDPRRAEVESLHWGIAPLDDDKFVYYRDLRSLFLNADGTLNGNMRDDAIHISSQGQEAWMKAIKPILGR